MQAINAARQIAQLAQQACMWEACAPKPGNVNRAHDFSDASLEDFLISAIAVGPALEDAGNVSIGETVRRAIADTRQRVRSNTNLGLMLLLTPLVKACLSVAPVAGSAQLRKSLSNVLRGSTVQDARLVYAAIRLARPGGMGQVSQADIGAEPPVTLLLAMELARERDSIAREYVTDFAITFETALPALRDARLQCRSFSDAVVQTFLTILSRVPDTLIARKRGFDTAQQVSHQANEVLMKGGVLTCQGRAVLDQMDRGLRDEAHTLNPGTTADLTAAAVFLALLEFAY